MIPCNFNFAISLLSFLYIIVLTCLNNSLILIHYFYKILQAKFMESVIRNSWFDRRLPHLKYTDFSVVTTASGERNAKKNICTWFTELVVETCYSLRPQPSRSSQGYIGNILENIDLWFDIQVLVCQVLGGHYIPCPLKSKIKDHQNTIRQFLSQLTHSLSLLHSRLLPFTLFLFLFLSFPLQYTSFSRQQVTEHCIRWRCR